LHDPADLLHVLHFHEVIHVEGEAKGLLEAAGQGHMPHGIPGGDVVRRCLKGDGLRINVERRVEGGLHFRQQFLHDAKFPLSLSKASAKFINLPAKLEELRWARPMGIDCKHPSDKHDGVRKPCGNSLGRSAQTTI
jgi:hypothetical protein